MERVAGSSLRGRLWGTAGALVLAVACAAPAGAQDLLISGQWIRSIVPMRPAGGYFTLKNDGDETAVLVGAASPGCASMMLHQSKQVNGVDQMVHVDKVEVPAHGSFKFAPGGYHIMCMKPTDAVKPGKSVSVTLKFADGRTISADFPVKNAMGN
jgi:hypothetical protein